MKNNIIYISFSLVILLAGCAKKLDKEPLGLLVDQSFYKTSDDLIQAVNAAYDPLGWESSGNSQNIFFNFIYGDIASDDAIAGGDGQEAKLIPIAEFYATSTDIGLLEVWKKLYIGIYRANIVIEKAPDSKASEAIKARVTTEAKFLRAYYYFQLIRMFGEIPLVTKIVPPSDIIRPKSSKAEIYAQIEADLKAAADALPLSYGTEKGRATRGAANGLLARVYLFQSNWDGVKKATDAVIGSGFYQLESDYSTVHSLSTENGVESVFEIQAISTFGTKDDWERKSEGTYMNKFIAPRGQLLMEGWGCNAPSDELVKEFEDDSKIWGKMDPRFKATILSPGDSVTFGTVKAAIVLDPTVSSVKHYCAKYLINKSLPTDASMVQGPSNQRVIRYADVLLMAAEAAFRLGDEPTARTFVNQVRARVAMPEYTNPITINEIWKERRLELAMEGLRFFDIVRQGRAASLIKATFEGRRFREGVNEVFPIPQAEIDLTNGVLTQNTGY
jgi:hypothetical protein